MMEIDNKMQASSKYEAQGEDPKDYTDIVTQTESLFACFFALFASGGFFFMSDHTHSLTHTYICVERDLSTEACPSDRHTDG